MLLPNIIVNIKDCYYTITIYYYYCYLLLLLKLSFLLPWWRHRWSTQSMSTGFIMSQWRGPFLIRWYATCCCGACEKVGCLPRGNKNSTSLFEYRDRIAWCIGASPIFEDEVLSYWTWHGTPPLPFWFWRSTLALGGELINNLVVSRVFFVLLSSCSQHTYVMLRLGWGGVG